MRCAFRACTVHISPAAAEADAAAPPAGERDETALAAALGVRGTPAFVIGNQFVPGAVDADTLKQLIADARKNPS